VRIKGEDYCLQENIDLLFAYPLPFYGLRLCKRSYLCVFVFSGEAWSSTKLSFCAAGAR